VKLFVSHLDSANQFFIAEWNETLVVLSLILLFIVFVSTKKSPPNRHPQDNQGFILRESTVALKGIAILFLFIGHFSIKCVDKPCMFEFAGMWAVVVFLFCSGIGISKTYGLNLAKPGFLHRRLLKLFAPTLFVVILFYSLDFLLLGKTYALQGFLLNCLGLFSFAGPNPALWFVTFIMYQYLLFFLLSKLNASVKTKVIWLCSISVCTAVSITIIPLLRSHFEMWCQYSIVFPASVTVGYFRIPIKKWVSKLFHLSPVLFLLLVVASLVIFYFDPFWDTVRNFPYPYSVLDKLLTLFRPLYLIAALIGIAYCLDNFNRESRFLSFLGKYSFEMYLLHMPLMVSYDFILFRKPLYAFFLVFIASILVLGYGLNRISEATNQLFAKIVGGLLS